MANITCHIVIVGCGLGGLAAAIALKRQGNDVTMLEQAARLSEVKRISHPLFKLLSFSSIDSRGGRNR